MGRTGLALACLVAACHGRGTDMSSKRHEGEVRGDPLTALASLFLAFDPVAAWQGGAHHAVKECVGVGKLRAQGISMKTSDAAVTMATIDQLAFMDLVTVDSVADAFDVFSRYAIVRVPSFLSDAEATSLLQVSRECGLRKNAFGSQSDRYTLWLAGDGLLSPEEQAATEDFRARVPFAGRAIFGDNESSWRSVTDAFGVPYLTLAEVVTSQAGGAPQTWHADGEGITAQISLIPVGELQGPTEVQPRALPPACAKWFEENPVPPKGNLTLAEYVKLNSPSNLAEYLKWYEEYFAKLPSRLEALYSSFLYECVTIGHGLAWAAMRPIVGNSYKAARFLIEAGLTPPVVYLTADIGCLTLHNGVMMHRGGQNRGDTERPILVVHIRKEQGYRLE